MNFRPELASAVMGCGKTVTRRLVSDNPRSPWWREQCAYRLGQKVAICPGRGKHAIGKARVTSVERMALGTLMPCEVAAEGFYTEQAFASAWAAINGTYDVDALVWRVGLEAIV